jgi:cephalosporin hydroxylase
VRPFRWLRLKLLRRLVAWPINLSWETWLNLTELVEQFRPTFVLELGRGYGNSTAVFTELSTRLEFDIVTIGFDSEHAWETITAPKIRRFFGRGWFSRLTVMQADITELDLAALVADHERVLVFWDAHGDDVAEAVTTRLLPSLPSANLVVVHDVYDMNGGDLPEDLCVFRGPYGSAYDELNRIWDFLSTHELQAQTLRDGLLHFSVASRVAGTAPGSSGVPS